MKSKRNKIYAKFVEDVLGAYMNGTSCEWKLAETNNGERWIIFHNEIAFRLYEEYAIFQDEKLRILMNDRIYNIQNMLYGSTLDNLAVVREAYQRKNLAAKITEAVFLAADGTEYVMQQKYWKAVQEFAGDLGSGDLLVTKNSVFYYTEAPSAKPMVVIMGIRKRKEVE